MGTLTAWPPGALKQKSMAVPLSGTEWGLPGALSVSDKFAVRFGVAQEPPARGEKAIWMVHVPLGAVEAEAQASDEITKSLETLAAAMVSAPANGPELLLVTVSG
jgi:hypothetical protein